MALILSDRVKVNTTTTGTGTVVLAATAPTGYQSFAVIGDNNTTYYTIAGQTSAEWEVGIGTYYLANSSLSRDTILSSSAANAAVVFGVGTKDVFVTYPAERSVYSNATSVVSLTDTAFSLSNASDTTKQARFNLGSLGTNNTIVYTLPSNATANTAVTLAGVNTVQTFTAAQTYSAAVTQGAGNYNYSATAATWAATAQTTGTFTIGGPAQTGTIGVGQSNATQITNLANGATIAASTKTLNIGTNGVSGSITNITVGSANGTTVNVLGNLSVDTNTLFVDGTNNLVGIGTTTPAYPLVVAGASNAAVVAQIYNANTNSSTFSQFILNAGTKTTTLSTSYGGNYFQIYGGGGIVTSFVDLDTQYFRNSAGASQLIIVSTASANNYVQVTGGAGVGPTISAQGADTNVDLKLTPKGTGYANITSGGVKLGNSTIQDSAGNLVFTTGGANVTAFTLDQNKLSTFAASIKETANVSTANATANVTLNAITQSVLYYTGNATANTTINITGNSTVTLNNAMANGQSISVVFMSAQGNTAYYVNGYQIDGVGVTPKWQGNAAPTSGNARGIDTYCFTAIKTGSATYTVLASLTQFA